MPRSLQLEPAAEASTTSMTAATTPWTQRPSSHARRPTAASFSAGDFRNQHQHQQMLAFEQQLDALVGGAEAVTSQQQRQQERFCSIEMEQLIRGSLERSVSTSSSVGLFAGSQSGASESAKSNLRLSVGSKITGRRHHTPRRFVVTDIPDFEEFNHMNPMKGGISADEGRRKLTAAQPRQGKTEVKGRFTIIDLSPESPSGSPRAQLSLPTEANSRHGSRHGASPRRRVHRKNARSELPTRPSSILQLQVLHSDPADSPPRTRRVDLNVFDRHLDYLQKESVGMKSLLEGMVSTNARWIDALSQAGVAFSNDQSSHRSSCTSVAEAVAVSPIEPEPSPVFESATEEKFVAMKLAYVELQRKHESLLAKNKQLEEQNETLRSRLQEETQTSATLRAQLQQLSDSEPSNGCVSDLTSTFGDGDDQGGEYSTECDNQYETAKNGHYWRRRRRSVEEECMSDTSSDGSLSKSPASAIPARSELEDICSWGTFANSYCFC